MVLINTSAHVFLMVILFMCMFKTTEEFLDWLFGDNKPVSPKNAAIRTGVQFEIQTADDKFLQLKEIIENLSELDACNHIVVSKLKHKCGSLSEEELGKLSVQLLNCQSQVEKRETFQCTDSMELADCTKDMDSITWNSYQIVNNRARALCYATQQQQFRKLTEVTVNQLVAATNFQLEYLRSLQEGQEQLHELTTHTVRELFESHKDLIGNQQSISVAQDGVLTQIHSNIEDLKREKAMIATGNKELAELTENIRARLDEATSQLMKQEQSQLASHEKITQDLTYIQQKSHDALSKLDTSSDHLVQNHKEMLDHYMKMYENMVKINATISHLLTAVNHMQRHLDERINWFSRLLHMADDKLSLLTSSALHIGYFLCAALAASFLQTPPITRIVLFLLVSLNATMEIQYGCSLDFASISLFLFTVSVVNWVYVWWCRRHHKISAAYTNTSQTTGFLQVCGTNPDSEDENQSQLPDTTTTGSQLEVHLSPVELRYLSTTLGRLYHSLNESTTTATRDGSETHASNRRHTQVIPGPSTSPSSPGPSTLPSSPFSNRPGPSASVPSAFLAYKRPERVMADSSSTVKDDVAKVRRYLENLDENLPCEADTVGDLIAGPRFTPSPAWHRSSSRSSNSTTRSLCTGLTKSGEPCRLTCVAGSDFCHRHREL